MRRNDLAEHATLDMAHTRAAPDRFVEVRGPRTQKLRCRYNPETHQLEFRDGTRVEIIDLRLYQPPEPSTTRGA